MAVQTIIQKITDLLRFWFLPAWLVIFILPGCGEKETVPDMAQYQLYCSPDSLQWLYDHPKEDHYIKVELSENNGPRKTGKLRLRGDTSRDFAKKSLKIKLDGPLSDGTTVLNLNAEFLDKSYLRQYLCSEIISRAGVPCFKTRHAAVSVNDIFHGVYLQVENMDEDFLARNGLDRGGALYKAARDGACLSKNEDVSTYWEKKTGDKKNMLDLHQLIDKINEVPVSHLQPVLEETFDYRQLISITALNIYLCNGSTWYHNYYLFHDGNRSGKWSIMPWDLDKTLTYYDWKLPFETSGDYTGDNVLAEKMFRCTPVMNDIDQELLRIDSLVKSMHIEQMALEAMRQLETWIEQDVRDDVQSADVWEKKCKETIDFFDVTLQHRKEQLALRDAQFETMSLPIYHGRPILRWTHCRYHPDSSVTYTVSWAPKEHLWTDSLKYQWTTTDSAFQVPVDFPPGTYAWKVEARMGSYRLNASPSVQWTEIAPLTLINHAFNTSTTLQGGQVYAILSSREFSGFIYHVSPGATLLLMPGVQAEISRQVNFHGTAENPIRVVAAGSWRGDEAIVFQNGSDNELKYVEFENVRVNYHGCNVTMDHCSIDMTSANLNIREGRLSMIWGTKGNLVMRHCSLRGNQTGEGLNVHEGSAIIEYNTFSGCPDAIELIDMHDSRIEFNSVRYSKDDAIDLNNSQRVTIRNNVLYHCADKGISIGADHYGRSKDISVISNYISRCRKAVEVKDSSNAEVQFNVFDNCQTAIAARRSDLNYRIGGQITCGPNYYVACDSCRAQQSDSLSTIAQLPGADTEVIARVQFGVVIPDFNSNTAVLNSQQQLPEKQITNDGRIILFNPTPHTLDIGHHELLCGSDQKPIFTFEGGIVIPPFSGITLFTGDKKQSQPDWVRITTRCPILWPDAQLIIFDPATSQSVTF
ncbi:MAG: CotH kinase family protein [Flavobacteriales bacterium]|nr:CotH kinase family protein [Flavobacteriales bacterium]